MNATEETMLERVRHNPHVAAQVFGEPAPTAQELHELKVRFENLADELDRQLFWLWSQQFPDGRAPKTFEAWREEHNEKRKQMAKSFAA